MFGTYFSLDGIFLGWSGDGDLGRGGSHCQTPHGETSSYRTQQTQLFPRVQSQVSFGQAPEALRGLIEMSLNLMFYEVRPSITFMAKF